MKRWEYNYIHVCAIPNLKNIDDLGLSGWELVCSMNGILYFKRELKPQEQKKEDNGGYV